MKNQTKFELLIVGVIILISVYITFNREKEISNIEENKGVTIATIFDCTSTVHDPWLAKIEYTYHVNGKKYSSKDNSFDSKFSKCVDSKDCIGKRFALYYNVSKPEESKIDFNDER